MKKEITIFDHANEIMTGLRKGALLNTVHDGKINTMTISWGTFGVEWERPVFITFVREHRFTKSILESTGEFTISIPDENTDLSISGFCGTHTGRTVDKIAETGLTPVPADSISVPGFKQYPITLECKLLYTQAQEPAFIPADIREKDYPQDVPSTAPMANKDFHTAFYGEIVRAYIITDD